MRGPALVHLDVPATPLVDGERIAHTLDAMFGALAAGRAPDAVVLDGLIELIACDIVTYAEDPGDGPRWTVSRTRMHDGWSATTRSCDDAPACDLGVYRITEDVQAADGTGVSFGCARAWQPFD